MVSPEFPCHAESKIKEKYSYAWHGSRTWLTCLTVTEPDSRGVFSILHVQESKEYSYG
jgi:hypothetical protein